MANSTAPNPSDPSSGGMGNKVCQIRPVSSEHARSFHKASTKIRQEDVRYKVKTETNAHKAFPCSNPVTYFSLAWWSLWNLFNFVETEIWGDPEAGDVVSGLVMAEIQSMGQTVAHRGSPIIRWYTEGPEAVEEACWLVHSTYRPTLCPPVESLENSLRKQTLSLNLEDCVFVQNKYPLSLGYKQTSTLLYDTISRYSPPVPDRHSVYSPVRVLMVRPKRNCCVTTGSYPKILIQKLTHKLQTN